MSGRVGNQLPNNLPQLQNCVKRDAESYSEEFLLQKQRYQALLDVVMMDPSAPNKDFEDLVLFMANICSYFTEEMADFPGGLAKLLKEYGPALNTCVRLAACKALIIVRNRGLVSATDLICLFFQLLRCQDKGLRIFLRNHIITDIKNMNAKLKNAKVNSHLQGFMYCMLDDSNPVAAKISLEIMMELYKKNVWKDAKTVNVIATACFSKTIKIMVTALTFFLGTDDVEKDEDDDDKDEDEKEDKYIPTAKDIRQKKMANNVSKKSRKKAKQLKRLEKAAKKVSKKEPKEQINFSALHLIHDPQGMAEKLLNAVQSMNERFEVKLMIMNLISRLIGVHELFVFNFYPLLQRYLQPHQREVTKILLYAAQSCHELVPPDVLEPLLKTVVNNFVSERNSTECITVGINTTREICSRCPLVMTEDLLQDLVMYQKYKDKNVSMAARSLIQLFRVINPSLLAKKDRGRPTEATIELQPKEYRELDAKSYIPGAEVLAKKRSEKEKIDTSECEDDDEWQSDEEDENENDGWETDEDEEVGQSDDGEEWNAVSEEEKEEKEVSIQAKETEVKEPVKSRLQENQERLKKIEEEAALVSSSRILTDEEFRVMRKNQIRKQVEAIHPRRSKKRKQQDDESASDVDSDAEDITERKEFVSLQSIERLYKKSKADKDSRLQTVMEGRKGRETFVKKHGKKNQLSSTKQKEKNKNKAFSMIKYKVKGKKKESFEQKQARLRRSLIKQAKQL